jgi:hypothetical protein
MYILPPSLLGEGGRGDEAKAHEVKVRASLYPSFEKRIRFAMNFIQDNNGHSS